ncbi:DUF2851 family protein [Echinicola sp. CAU 1574]|uniref:DUF2851 family protein n=1 Tax=Echinicola arenosa TaxID=2774144 RepID=A0ABR9AH19_9BACT|nr:DUF2851 family protein [Echinicola arenosa]MBD8488063.1 DUF2851 family protein [Echinicola arenosa]
MNFQENFIQAVWKYQYFEKLDLKTVSGVPLSVKKIGYHNFHEGPDFLESQIILGNIEYHGNIEVHLKSSGWNAHGHEQDDNYESVILHVVWEHDTDIKHKDGTLIPTLELKGRVFLDVIRNYERLIAPSKGLLCGEFLDSVGDIIKFSMLEKALVERLYEKANVIKKEVELTAGDWEEVTYRWLFYCFGFKVNSSAMLKLARSLPYKILKKHSGQPLVQEALLLGQAGFHQRDVEISDDYTSFVKREYGFYQSKYGLSEPFFSSEWKFMSVRPSNYPSVRIAQLASILSHGPNLFSALKEEVNSVEDLLPIFQVKPSNYWEHHYQLGKASLKSQNRVLSKRMINLLGINFVVPLWFAYGNYTDDPAWKERCFDFLQGVPAEENSIVRSYLQENWQPQNAFDSQAMIGMHHHYCSQKKCLDCKIGQNLLRPRK